MDNNIVLNYSEKEIYEIIYKNLLLMLIERGKINNKNMEKYKSLFEKNINDEYETYVELEKDEIKNFNCKKIYVKFINRKLTTIRKIADIENFMTDNENEYKFIIVSNISAKAIKQLLEYKNTEIFNDYELKINIIDHVLVPKHYILNEEEKIEFLESYKLKLKDLKRMLITDPISKYYNLSKGSIVRIERPSLNSGISIDYRIVV